jgi:serine/threonine-protein kinase RsbW
MGSGGGEESTLSAPNRGRRSLRLSSTMESVGEVEAAADELAADAGLDEDARFHVTMAIHEAAINAVLHGNDYNPKLHIDVSMENTGTELVFVIADQGQGFDPDHLPDPSAPENILRGTGRGIFLIRSLMDEVRFRRLDPGMEMTLIKRLTPASEEQLDGDKSGAG